MRRNDVLKGALVAAAGLTLGARRPVAAPTPAPSPDPQAEKLFSAAREWWRNRVDLPYLQYAVLIRYNHAGHVFDNWYETTLRTKDHALHLERVPIPADEAKRLRGFPITILGFKIGDTNADSEPIRVEPPAIDPTSDFGMIGRYRSNVDVNSEATANPLAEPEGTAEPLRQIGSVQASTRDYDVRLVGEDSLRYGDAYHLSLTPLHDPRLNRLRDVWVAKKDFATLQLSVDGIYNGKPYDGVRWTVGYVPIDSRLYVQQVRAENLHFGLDIGIQAMEFDFVDYRFPTDVPKFTFDRLLL